MCAPVSFIPPQIKGQSHQKRELVLATIITAFGGSGGDGGDGGDGKRASIVRLYGPN